MPDFLVNMMPDFLINVMPGFLVNDGPFMLKTFLYFRDIMVL